MELTPLVELRRVRGLCFFLLGPSSRHLSLPGLENCPRSFILTPLGAPSGSQEVAEVFDFWGSSDFPVVECR